MEQYKQHLLPRYSKIITGYGNDHVEQELDRFLKVLHNNNAVDIQTSISTTAMEYNGRMIVFYSILVTYQQIA